MKQTYIQVSILAFLLIPTLILSKINDALFYDKPDKCTQIQQAPLLSSTITAEIAIGELIDKITILEIKLENINDPEKLKNVKRELESLRVTYNFHIMQSDKLKQLKEKLKYINKKLWNIEDAIRAKEAKKQFDNEFIELARSVYFTNDERCRIKREINELAGSNIMEEKSYTDYVQYS